MKKALNCFVHKFNNHALASINKHFYVLRETAAKTDRYAVQNAVAHDGQVFFAVFEKENLVVITDDSRKLVNFYHLNDVVDSSDGTLKTPFRTQ
jgi:hypothetical protein